MTTLTQLIEHYCPNGVEYVKLGDVATVKAGSPVSKQKIAESAGIYPVINSGREPLGFIAEFNSTDPIGITTRGAGVGFVSWTEGPHFKGNLNYNVKVNSHIVSDRFLFFTLKEHGDSIRDLCSFAGIPALNLKSIKTLVFPLPPREVQDAIVERLDAFAALIESLDSEITLREKRFEYFREQIFSTLDHEEPLGYHGTFLRGRGIQKKDFQDTGKPAFHYGQVHTRYGLSTLTTAALVSDEVFNRSAQASPGDLIIATTSEDDEAVGKAVVWLGQEQAAVGSDAHFFEHSYDPRFIGYFFTTHSFHDQKIPYLTGAKVRRINAKSLASIRAPWPPREVQQDIADKLDTMQALIDNLKQERDLRKIQFEYYREKLLTFNS